MSDSTTVVKCLVWDLDNTLWQGTLLEGDDVLLADEVRAVIVALDARGILQSVASRNDHDLAWERLERLGVAEYFVCPRIGWGRKSDSVQQIADELNFAPETIAFIDDQATERAEVTYHLSQVRCYPAEQVGSLVGLPEFTPRTVTVDSKRRRQMYQAKVRREAEQSSFNGPDEEFLRSLNLVLRIDRAGEEELARVEELTLRTSQMNATGVHYSDAALRELLDDPRHEVLTATMTDRFGPHGAVGVLLLRTYAPVWHLKLLATSCRVVSFGAGTVILNWLSDSAARAGTHIVADFRPTARNRMMEIAYRFAGYSTMDCACLAVVEAPGLDDIQRLHLVATRREAPTTLELVAPSLVASGLAR